MTELHAILLFGSGFMVGGFAGVFVMCAMFLAKRAELRKA